MDILLDLSYRRKHVQCVDLWTCSLDQRPSDGHIWHITRLLAIYGTYPLCWCKIMNIPSGYLAASC